MRNLINCLLLFLFAANFYSCSKDYTDVDDTSGCYVFTLTSDDDSILQGDTYLFFFDDDNNLVTYCNYDFVEDYRQFLNLDSGSYTVLALTNADADLVALILSGELTLQEILELLGDYDLDTMGFGVMAVIIDALGNNEITIDVVGDIDDLDFSALSLAISYPIDSIPEYTKSGDSSLRLRTTIELLKSGSSVYRGSWFLDEQDADLNYLKSIYLNEGDYDLVLWADYVSDVDTDYHYDTSNLSNVSVLSSSLYTANSDYRDAFVMYTSVTVSKDDTSAKLIETYRPAAKYSIVSTDVEKYNESRVENGYAEVSDLDIQVTYNGYFPSAYSVTTGKLTNALTGYSYSSAVSSYDDQSATIAKDFVMVANGNESSVSLSIVVKNTDGEIINEFNSITVAYKSGYHTTVTGNFLTQSNGGFVLEQDWDGEFNVNF